MIKALIFDMDGTVIDSNHIHWENWNSVLQKHFNVRIPKKEFASRLGESSKHFTDYFIETYSLDINRGELWKLLEENYNGYREKIQLKEGVLDVLSRFYKKYHIALATGADRTAALYTVTNYNLAKYFDFIIGGDEVKIAKPNPEIFLKAAEQFKVKPKECLVIEDALMGIKAAKAGGMHVISIPDDITQYQDHSIADMQLKSMHQLDEKILKKLSNV